MTEIPTLLTETIEGVTVTETGRHAIFKLKGETDSYHFALPSEKMIEMIIFASNAAAEANRILTRDPSTKHAFPVDSWEIGSTPAGDIVLSFRVPGGMELSFQLPTEAAGRYAHSLAAAVAPKAQ